MDFHYRCPGGSCNSVSGGAPRLHFHICSRMTQTRYVTMPLDTSKLRMQSLDARTFYGSTFRWAVSILSKEDVLVSWSGALPRLGRLVVSGGTVFPVYAFFPSSMLL